MKSAVILTILFLTPILGFSPYLNQGENLGEIQQKMFEVQPRFTIVELIRVKEGMENAKQNLNFKKQLRLLHH